MSSEGREREGPNDKERRKETKGREGVKGMDGKKGNPMRENKRLDLVNQKRER